MKKRLAAIILSAAMALAASVACLGLAACEITADTGTTVEPEEGTLEIREIRDVGEYSGYEVHFVQLYRSGTDVSDEVKRIVMDDVYIYMAANTSFKYIIYLNDSGDEDSYILLQSAYEQGLITHDDLRAIAEREAQYDNSREPSVAYLVEVRDVGEYSGYEIYFAQIGLLDKAYHSSSADIIIDDVYICTVKVDMYDYFLCPNGEDEDPVLLSEAYAYGLISYDDLEAIAEAEATYLASNADDTQRLATDADGDTDTQQ